MKAILAWYDRRSRLLREQGIFIPVKNRSGYVLILVLVVIALLVGISGDMIISQQTSVHYLKSHDRLLRAELLSRSASDLAKMLLEADLRGLAPPQLSGVKGVSGTDSYRDIWAVHILDFPLGTGTISLFIEDENSKINISSLANQFVNPTPYYSMVQRLMIELELSMDLADIIIDWVDPDNIPYPRGAETSYYSTLPLSYAARNAPFESLEEMLLLKDIDPLIFYGFQTDNKNDGSEVLEEIDNERRITITELLGDESIEEKPDKPEQAGIGPETTKHLERFFRVHGDDDNFLSESNRININTASFRVLSALTDDMTFDKVTEIISRRQEGPFTSVDQVADIITDENVRNNLLTVKSTYFKINILAEVEGVQQQLTAIYDRNQKKYVYYALH